MSDYIPIEEAQGILGVSLRQVHNYLTAEKLRSRKEGRRRMLLAEDVYRLADELGVDAKRQPPQPSVEMVPDTGPLIDYLREKDQQLLMMSRRIGELEAQLGARLLPEDLDQVRQDLADAKAEAKFAREEAQRLRELYEQPKSFWKRLLGQ